MERPVRPRRREEPRATRSSRPAQGGCLGLTETHHDLDLSATHDAIHSEQRYPQAGGRWTTIWSALPIIEQLQTSDPRRCVAVRLDAGDSGQVIVYGTVLPWNGDAGPDPANPARGWDEFPRVIREQAADWAALRELHPTATLVVAGDLNQNLGGPHYYGTKVCRALLRSALDEAGLTCLTTTEHFADGVLDHPPIDHVCAGAGHGRSLSSRVEGWNNVVADVRLSDHGGVLASIEIRPQ